MGRHSLVDKRITNILKVVLIIFGSVAIIAAGLILLFARQGEEEARLLFFLFYEGQTVAMQILRIIFICSIALVFAASAVLSMLHTEQAAKILFIVSATAAILAVGLICVFLFMQGLPAIWDIGVFNFLTGTEWRPTWNPPLYGILPMIVGSLYVTAGAILFGVPIGIFAAVFMAKFCP